MNITDPISDLLTRLRNALRIRRKTVKVARSKMNGWVLDILQREGYIHGYEKIDGMANQGMFLVKLKYGADGEAVIQNLQRVSKPGRRMYTNISDLRPVINGLGINILSTSKGVMSDREAKEKKVGGEVLCTVW